MQIFDVQIRICAISFTRVQVSENSDWFRVNLREYGKFAQRDSSAGDVSKRSDAGLLSDILYQFHLLQILGVQLLANSWFQRAYFLCLCQVFYQPILS